MQVKKGGLLLSGALKGIRILDLSRVLAGPYCTMILGDLGAEVIKVEAPGGSDDTRSWGPPFKKDVSAYYMSINRNKKSITVNLKSSEGIKKIQELIKVSDVIIHNFKTGTMEKFGLSYEEVSALNPEIVYCSITGFGETGPYKDLAGYDFITQAMSGLMSITGDEDSGPQKLGVAITDILTGLYAVIGIQAALLERTISGQGQKIDMSLYDSAVSSLVNIGSGYLMSGEIPERLGNRHANIAPYQTFHTKDGEIVIAVGNNGQFKRLCSILEIPEISEEDRFSTNAKRVENREELTEVLQDAFYEKETSYWQSLCEKSGVPSGPIQTLDQMREDPQLKARDMFVTMEHPKAGKIDLIGSPLKLSRTPVEMKYHPPEVGEHEEEILHLIKKIKENTNDEL